MRRSKTFLLLAGTVALLGGGCSGDPGSMAFGAMGAMSDFDPLTFFENNKTNMVEKNYAAADYLYDRGRGFVKPGTTIKAIPIQDIQEPRLMTQFGRQVPEQIGERLQQLGFNVDLSAVSTDVNPQFSQIPQPSPVNPAFVLGGSYIRRGNDLEIRVNITDAVSGVERATFNYTLPRTSDIRKKSKPQPTIYRLPNN